MKRQQIITLFLFLALGGLGYVLLSILLPYLEPVMWAVVLAMVFFPVFKLLRRALRRWDNMAAGLMTILVFAVAVVPGLLLTGALAREAVEGYRTLSTYAAEGNLTVLNRLSEAWFIEPIWEWLRERMASGTVDATGFALSGVKWASEFAATRATAIARNVFEFAIATGIMTFTLFFLFRDGETTVESLRRSIPMMAADRDRIFDSFKRTVLAVVQGLTLTALAQGVLVGLALWAVGVQFSLLLGAVACLCAFLPVGGAALVWVPAVVTLALSDQLVSAGALLAWGLLVVSSVDNLLRPYLISSQARLSTPLLFFGIICGLRAFGFIGLFLGPALLATFAELMRTFRELYAKSPS